MPSNANVGAAVLIGLIYLTFVAVGIGGYVYMLVKLAQISRSVAAIAAQQERQSLSLESLANSGAALARGAAAPRPIPPGPPGL